MFAGNWTGQYYQQRPRCECHECTQARYSMSGPFVNCQNSLAGTSATSDSSLGGFRFYGSPKDREFAEQNAVQQDYHPEVFEENKATNDR